ncbi:MAG: biopolymer transporter ExbD [Planctomycetales bacterium]|nr:biopolymer transporter ExbD [Planctomycetales bacterium]MBN8626052.1 biopolymer transporter ExbD [Planctomycetota bacterium]
MAKMPGILQDRQVDGPVLARRPLSTDNNLDITPMIDVTFLLLIFFLVAAVPDVQAAPELPTAQFGESVSQNKAVIITVAVGATPEEIRIFLGPAKSGTPLGGSPESQDEEIRRTVDTGKSSGKTEVIIKAERRVRHRDVARVMQAAAMEGMKIHLAVSDPR